MFDTLIGIFRGVRDAILESIKSVVQNLEATTILTLSAIGTTALASSMPYTVVLPAVVESLFVAPFVIPVISVLFITGLCMIMKWRLGLEGV